MKVFYVRPVDNDDYDGVWIDKDTKFYASESKARAVWGEMEDELWEQWDQRKNEEWSKWRKKETAFNVLVELGVDAEAIIPYHKHVFTYPEFKPNYMVDLIEVEE